MVWDTKSQNRNLSKPRGSAVLPGYITHDRTNKGEMTTELATTQANTAQRDYAALMRRVSLALAVFVALCGCVAVAGSFGEHYLIEGVKFAAGFGMVCCGLAVLLLCDGKGEPSSTRRIAAQVLCGVAVVISLLNLMRFLEWPTNGAIRQLLDVLHLPTNLVLTLTPNDALQLLLIAVAAATIPYAVHKRVTLSEIFCALAGLLSIMTLFGIVFGMPHFCIGISCLKISVVAGLLFGLLCIAVVLSRPDRGVVSIISENSLGGYTARILFPATLLIPLVLGWLRTQAEHFHLFGPGQSDTGVTFVIAGMVMSFLVLIWISCNSLAKIDRARREALVKLEQSEKRTRMIVQQAIDAFVSVDTDGVITNWNTRAEATFGWTAEQAIGKRLVDILVPYHLRKQASESGNTLIQTGPENLRYKPVETAANHKDGFEFPVELSVFPVQVDDEHILCAFVRDITERKEMERRFKDFYSTVSHELRSPLTSIRGCLTLIKEMAEGELPESTIQMLGIADASCERLIRLINDLLDVKRIEEGKFTLDLQVVDAVKLATLAVDGLRGYAAKVDVSIEIIVEDAMHVDADADRVVQVLTNLISNALKFSPEGGVVLLKISKGNKRVRFSVTDQGPGIPPEQMHKLFSRFGQLGDKDSRKKLGTGLGLAISKAIIQEHNGEIGVESVIGKGSTFWFELGGTIEPAVFDSQIKTLELRRFDQKEYEEMKKASDTRNRMEAQQAAPEREGGVIKVPSEAKEKIDA